MIVAEARIADIADILRVRLSVRENILGDPSKVTPADVARMIERDGKGWVCAVEGTIRGFSFADRTKNNIWALFVEPGFDRKGIGRRLHDLAVAWLFEAGRREIWLSTALGSRAEGFYRAAGWIKTGDEPNDDIRMVLMPERWNGRTL